MAKLSVVGLSSVSLWVCGSVADTTELCTRGGGRA